VSNSRSRDTSADTRRSRGSSRASAGDELPSPDPSSEPEPRLAQVFIEQTDEFISWIDADARMLYGNPAICRALGYSQTEFLSLHAWDVSPSTRESWPLQFADMRERPNQVVMVEMHGKNGAVLPSRCEVRYREFAGKEYLFCHAHDLRQEPDYPQEAVRIDSHTALASAVDAIFLLHEGAIVDAASHSQESSSGARKQILADLKTMLHEGGAIEERIARALGGEEVTFNWYSVRSGERVNIECTLTRIEVEGAARLLAVAVDVTSRRKSARTLAQLSGRLLELQDEERRRIARELHDTTGQNLGALSMNLSTILASARIDAHSREALRESVVLADACVREIRTLSYLLHPPLLDELGLVSALRAYCEGYAERTGIQLELDLPSNLPRLPQAIEIALFRIVQEGLTNIHRHSGSQTATLRLKEEPGLVEMELSDRGRGLSPRTLDWDVASASRIGVGIAGMRERARQLGGRLTIASGDTGTILRVTLPVLHP
jgi:PAS domain S-box-containing protein